MITACIFLVHFLTSINAKKILTIIFISYFLFHSSQARIFIRQYRSTQLRTQKGWLYLDRMTMAPGTMKIMANLNLQTNSIPAQGKYKLTLQAIPDQIWSAQSKQKCQLDHEQKQEYQNKKKAIKIQIPLSPTSKPPLSHSLSLSFGMEQTTTYYLVLKDCGKSLINQYFNKKSKFEIQLVVTNNGHNYGDDEKYLLWVVLTIVMLAVLMLFWIGSDQNGHAPIRGYAKLTAPDQEINWATILLRVIIWGHFAALSFWLFEHLIYIMGKGQTYQFFNFIYLMSSTFSETLILLILTFTAYGWMIRYKSSDNDQIFFPIAFVFGFASIVLVLLSKINDNQFTKTHMYDSLAINVQIIFKIVGLCTFLLGIVRSLLISPHSPHSPASNSIPFSPSHSPSPSTFFISLGLFGIFCFLAVPFLQFFSDFMNIHTRASTIFIWVEIIRTLQIGIITYQVLWKKSFYANVTLFGRSFMQIGEKIL